MCRPPNVTPPNLHSQRASTSHNSDLPICGGLPTARCQSSRYSNISCFTMDSSFSNNTSSGFTSSSTGMGTSDFSSSQTYTSHDAPSYPDATLPKSKEDTSGGAMYSTILSSPLQDPQQPTNPSPAHSTTPFVSPPPYYPTPASQPQKNIVYVENQARLRPKRSKWVQFWPLYIFIPFVLIIIIVPIVVTKKMNDDTNKWKDEHGFR
ncbi:hypothetical protein BDV96DRAFT_572315 [Lophiotrema nucula]|uniref:Uncharacterized protein n=1 Tax=Lophiotrema nucula TaxID=690887 RepID=A0A6A5ZC91_9PLEO|nr:hypothetical protein BDV96DRAFT_572315 [Lophiotrema nucula]